MFNPSSNFDFQTLMGELDAAGLPAKQKLSALTVFHGAAVAAAKGRNYTPRNEAIAKIAGCCKRTVQRMKKKLRETGLVVTTERFVIEWFGGIPKARQISNRMVTVFTSPPISVLQAVTEARWQAEKRAKRERFVAEARLHEQMGREYWRNELAMMRGDKAVTPERRTKYLYQKERTSTYATLMDRGLHKRE